MGCGDLKLLGGLQSDDKGGVKVWTFSEPVTMYKELDGVVADAVVDLAWNASSTRLCVVGDNKKGWGATLAGFFVPSPRFTVFACCCHVFSRAVVVDLSSNEMVCSAAGSTDPYVLCAYSRTGDERVAFANNDATVRHSCLHVLPPRDLIHSTGTVVRFRSMAGMSCRGRYL